MSPRINIKRSSMFTTLSIFNNSWWVRILVILIPMILSINDDSDWRFFKKGKANALYEYVGDKSKFKGKLLRMRLSDQTIKTIEVFNFIQKKVRPLLPEVINCELVEIKFQKKELLNDGFGLLIPSLVPEGASIEKTDRYFNTFIAQNQFILELKPKWLSESTNNCRNCAHHLYKHGRSPEFCSLDLLNHDTLQAAIQLITDDSQLQAVLYQYFSREDNILQTLSNLQKSQVAIADITEENQVTNELCSIMTFRDVTVFFIIINDMEVNAVVTDTDPKHKSKWKHWVSTEKELQGNGYYKRVTKHR